MYNNIEQIIDSEHIKLYQIMMKYIKNNIIIDNIDFLLIFLEDTEIIAELNIILLPIKNIINNDMYIIIKDYIINATLAKILLINYRQGDKILVNHHIAIRLRAHNILRKAQLQKLCNM